MDKRETMWLVMKGLSFASIGGILYTLLCLRGT